MDEGGWPAGRQAGRGEGTQVSRWSRKQSGEALEVLHWRQTKHEHEK